MDSSGTSASGLGRKLRIGLVASVAALATFVVAAAPLSALPPPPDEDSGPIDPIDPPPTTRPPAPPAPRVLESLSVTVESVVATATVHYNGSPSLVTIQWGDGTSTSRNPNEPVDSPFPNPWETSSPPGTVVFQHTYTAPSDGHAFPVSITAQIGNEARSVPKTVTPLYRVTQYAVTVTPLERCDDPTFEDYSEWQVIRRGGYLPNQTWEFEVFEPDGWVGGPEDYPTSPYTLPNSAISVDVPAGQRRVSYEVTEEDWLDNDLGESQDIDLDPMLGSRHVRLAYWDVSYPFELTCETDVEADISVRLLTPGRTGGPVATQ